MPIILIVFLIIIAAIVAISGAAIATVKSINKKYKELEAEVLKELNILNWHIISYYDETVIVKSRQALEKYDDIRFFKENREKLVQAKCVIKRKKEIVKLLSDFLDNNKHKEHSQYNRLVKQVNRVIQNAREYRICVTYISYVGNNLGSREIAISQYDIDRFEKDPSLLMGKGEYNKFLKEKEKNAVSQKQKEYYERVNELIDYANENKNFLFIKNSVEQLDNLITRLFDRTVNGIKKIKDINSEEWETIDKFITQTEDDVKGVVNRNQRILEYYDSPAFLKIKGTCEALMSTQREFNEYIKEKVAAVSQLFGTRVIRDETISEDKYQYVRPYKKTITPFTAEVSAAVFASAENNPLEYIIKYFYSDKNLYPEQIRKLHLLVEELATLKDAKLIIDNYKKEYQQYINDVPDYVMEEDEAGFYSRLGFANIDENVFAVEYMFSYTSGGGMAKRKFSVPMTEETIVELIRALENKLSTSAFTKEQRALMTNKLREYIKKRDNYTCCNCGNSIHNEPNLLLEIHHIIPVLKGGCTIEDNLQTLCWKCNRAKSNKMLN